jgi:spore coat protein H
MQTFMPHSSAGWIRALFLALVPALIAVSAGAAEKTKKAPGDKFFTEPEIRTFHFEVSEAALNQLRRSPRSYITGTVREGQHVLTNVAIRLKGMGSFRSIDEKPSLAVKFDEFATNQHYRGLNKLMFNNSVQDSSYLAEMLATQLFRDAGLPAARSTHARVQLNGRDLGLYVMFEAMNKQFLKQHFTDAGGNLYEAYLGDVDGPMEQDGGTDTSMADLRALHAACRVPDQAQRWRELNKVLDVDRFVSFVAMEMLTSHWDGYAIHTNNYRIYHDPRTGQFTFITHGIDWAFRRPNISIQPPMKSVVGRAVLTTAEGQKLYRERIGTLFTNVFKVPVITQRMQEALTKIRRARLSENQMAEIERRAVWLRQQVEARAINVSHQLQGIEMEPLKFDDKGVARPDKWRDEPDRGEALMNRVKLDGKDTLHIQARNERTRASWRSQAFLKRGWYRFEGLARLESLTSGSARLRISGDTRSVGISGTGGAWRPLAHVFEVRDEAGMDIEFVCELNAIQGEVWFDVGSLRVGQLTAQEAQQFNNVRRTILE